MKRTRIPSALLLLGVLVLAAALAMPRLRPPVFHGTDLGPGVEPVDFTLEAASRGPVSLSDFRGHAVVVFFGYTTCPDICPLTMAKLRRVMELLGDRRANTRVLFVSVDPELDSPEDTRAYVQAFDLGFIGLTGDAAAIGAAARAFGVYVGEPEVGGSGTAGEAGRPAGHAGHEGTGGVPQRLVAHSPYVFGLDREGARRVIWGGEATAEEIAADIRSLLRL